MRPKPWVAIGRLDLLDTLSGYIDQHGGKTLRVDEDRWTEEMNHRFVESIIKSLGSTDACLLLSSVDDGHDTLEGEVATALKAACEPASPGGRAPVLATELRHLLGSDVRFEVDRSKPRVEGHASASAIVVWMYPADGRRRSDGCLDVTEDVRSAAAGP